MGKQTRKSSKLLYQKSNSTLNTRSKTNSVTSLSFTKSKTLQSARKHAKCNYYVNNGKLKRDLSIETDICILRGYCKRKFGRYKHSVNTTDVGTIDELNGDQSACGDSVLEDNAHNETRFNIDVTNLVVKNLKDLLNDWIKKYLLNNNETKQKIETVLDSILHKLELQRNTSSCTYKLNIKVDGEKLITSNCHKNNSEETCSKRSCQTMPITGKHIRLISTLSIPRNMKNQVNDIKFQSLQQTSQKRKYKKIFLTVSRSSTFLLNSSNFNLLSISTKSFTKRCATYEGKEIKIMEKKNEVLLLPKYSTSSYTETITDAGFENLINLNPKNNLYPNPFDVEPMQSLVKSIYADDPANITSTENNLNKCKNDNYTMTNSIHNQKINCSGKKANSDESMPANIEENISKTENNSRTNKYSKLMKRHLRTKMQRTKLNKRTQYFKCPERKIRHFTYPYGKRKPRKTNNKLFKNLKNILNYFSPYTNSKNITMDFQINITLGLCEKMLQKRSQCKSNNNRSKNVTATYNVLSNQLASEINANDIDNHIQKHESEKKPVSEPKLISLLDGAASQSKYVISKDTSFEKKQNMEKENNFTHNSPAFEISKDISELRLIIKNLALTTETFVKEHLKRNKCPLDVTIKEEGKPCSFDKIKDDIKTSTISKDIQFSNDIVKSQIISGLKLKKEPKKKDLQEFNTRLSKNSVSYNVIESESILKVTDMTAADINIDRQKFIDRALNCSLPKSKSQCVVTAEQNKRKLLAYYCDELIKPKQFGQIHNTISCSRNIFPHAVNNSSELINKEIHKIAKEGCCNELVCVGSQLRAPLNEEDCEIYVPGDSCSSIYIEVEDRSKKFTVRSRSGVGFWEGLIYCILLWIPVIVILWLIYVYVIKDIIQPSNPAIGRTNLQSPNPRNNSFFHITLSDLGF